LPVDFNLIKRVVTSFNNLHFDKDTGILYSIPAARVYELRGSQSLISISTEESNALITLAASISNDGSTLEILLTKYLTYCEERKKGQKTFKNLIDFIKHVLFNENNLEIFEQEVKKYLLCFNV
jgi:hypothetical protein